MHFASAPWSTVLKATSVLTCALVLIISVAAAKAIPSGTNVPYARAVGTIVAFIPPCIPVVAALFIVAGYELEGHELRVRRLLWSTRISLAGLRRIHSDPGMMKSSIRIFGNGGLFAFTGIYQNRAIGRYRAFVTDSRHSVALFLPGRVVVISPADISDFMHSIQSQFPRVEVGPPRSAS